VDAFDAVRIPDPAALAAGDVQGIWIEVRGGAGRASWHDPDRLLVNGSRPGCQLPVDGFCVDHIGEATTDSVGGWGETSLDALRPAHAPDDLADLAQLHLAAIRHRRVDRDPVHPGLRGRDRLPGVPFLVGALESVLAAVFRCRPVTEHRRQRAEDAAV